MGLAGTYILARYGGNCDRCPEPIKQGEEVRHVKRGVIRHRRCDEKVTNEQR